MLTLRQVAATAVGLAALAVSAAGATTPPPAGTYPQVVAPYYQPQRLYPVGPCCFPSKVVNGIWVGYHAQLYAEPGPPYPTLPPALAIVHLKDGVCNQRASVTVPHIAWGATGGKGLLLYADLGSPASFHWLSSQPPASVLNKTDARIYNGFYDVISFPVAGHYTLTYASSDCPVPVTNPQTYIANATVISVTVK